MLELLIGLELASEFSSHVLLPRFSFRRFRQQRLRLDLKQPCCDHQEGTQIGESLILIALEVSQVLVGHARQRHPGDVQFGMLDDLQQELERPLKDIELNRVGLCQGLPRSRSG